MKELKFMNGCELEATKEVFQLLEGNPFCYTWGMYREGDLEKVCIIEEGLSMWEDSKEVAMCTYHDKPIDELTLREILNMYDKDKRLLTTNHCIRFTILMIEDSYISIKDYKGVVIHPRDLYLEEEEY